MEIDDEGLVDEQQSEDTLELAPTHEFIPPAQPPADDKAGAGEAPAAATLPEERLEEIAREAIEKIAWEVIPRLAETILREEIEKLVQEKLKD